MISILFLSFSSPLLFLLFTWLTYREWKAKKTPKRKVAAISFSISTAVLILFSIKPIYYSMKSLGDPFFFVPLIDIIFFALPVALGTFVLSWIISSIILRA